LRFVLPLGERFIEGPFLLFDDLLQPLFGCFEPRLRLEPEFLKPVRPLE
jgi:hypothetical protein